MMTVHRRRIAGATWQEISEELFGNLSVVYPVEELHREYNEYLSQIRETTSKANLQQQELDRLDMLHNAIWAEAINGDDRAINTLLKISAQRSKLLGLDLPDPTDSTVQAQVLILGNDQRAWMEALAEGKAQGRVEASSEPKEITHE